MRAGRAGRTPASRRRRRGAAHPSARPRARPSRPLRARGPPSGRRHSGTGGCLPARSAPPSGGARPRGEVELGGGRVAGGHGRTPLGRGSRPLLDRDAKRRPLARELTPGRGLVSAGLADGVEGGKAPPLVGQALAVLTDPSEPPLE